MRFKFIHDLVIIMDCDKKLWSSSIDQMLVGLVRGVHRAWRTWCASGGISLFFIFYIGSTCIIRLGSYSGEEVFPTITSQEMGFGILEMVK